MHERHRFHEFRDVFGRLPEKRQRFLVDASFASFRYGVRGLEIVSPAEFEQVFEHEQRVAGEPYREMLLARFREFGVEEELDSVHVASYGRVELVVFHSVIWLVS